MKKILLGLMALSAVSFAAQGDTYLNVRFGGEFGGSYSDYEYEGTTLLSDETDSFGGELALEGYKSITDNFDLGLGIAYQIHADRSDTSIHDSGQTADIYGVEYDSVPVYLTAKYKFNLDSKFKPYLKANIGYSFNSNPSDLQIKGAINKKSSTDIENGLYWAVGGGLEVNNFTLDLMYAVTEAKSESKIDEVKANNDYGRFVLSAGYKFNL